MFGTPSTDFIFLIVALCLQITMKLQNTKAISATTLIAKAKKVVSCIAGHSVMFFIFFSQVYKPYF